MTFFDQTAYEHIPTNAQLYLFALAWSGAWSGKSREDVRAAIQGIIHLHETQENVRERIDKAVTDSETMEELLSRVQKVGLAGIEQ